MIKRLKARRARKVAAIEALDPLDLERITHHLYTYGDFPPGHPAHAGREPGTWKRRRVQLPWRL
jgi:hypothetical protein